MTEKLYSGGESQRNTDGDIYLRVVRVESNSGGIGGGFALGHEQPIDYELPLYTEAGHDTHGTAPDDEVEVTLHDAPS